MVDLRDLGPSSYEERAYTALLELRTGSASEIAAGAEIPEGRIYDALHELETRKLVHKSDAQRPQVYRAVDPDTAIDRLVETQTQKLAAERSRLQRVAAELRNTLGQSYPMDGRFWATRTRETALEFVHDQIGRFSAATDEVLIVGDSTLTRQFTEASGAVRTWLESLEATSFSVQILLSEQRTAKRDQLLDVLTDAANVPIGPVEVRMHSAVTANFDLIDQSHLFLYTTDPFARTEPIGTIRVNESDIIEELREEFTVYWREGSNPVEDR